MKTLAIAGLCAGLAVAPLATRAAELVVYGPMGQPIGVLVPVAAGPSFLAQPIGFPVAGIFAQQDALIRRMMSDMQVLQTAMMPLPDTSATIPALATMGAGPGNAIMVSSFSDGHDSCSRTVTYRMQPGAAPPIVNVSQTGDACGPASAMSPRSTTPVAQPVLPQAVPQPSTPGNTHLYQIDYRHRMHPPVDYRG